MSSHSNFNKPESCQPGSVASNNSNESSAVIPINVNSPSVHNCKVIVEDIFANDETGKSKALNGSQDKTHSAHSRKSADLGVLDCLEKKPAILWPQMADEGAWVKLEAAVMPKVLQSSLPISQTMSLLQDEIYSQASKLFGFVNQQKKRIGTFSRRTLLSIKLVHEKNHLSGQILNCVDEEKEGLCALLESVKLKLRNLRKGESKRKKRWKAKKAFQDFKKNPFQAGKDVLDPKCQAKLECTRAVLDAFKSATVSDTLFNSSLSPIDGLPPAPKVSSIFDSSSFKLQDFEKIVRSRRNASAPGINMIPYKVYKKCPQLMSFLFKLCLSCQRNQVIPIHWRVAHEVYIPKNKPPNPNLIKDFRPISLINVESKLFFSLVSQRFVSHIINNNKFINASIQKGCMEKIPGCWEHMSMVWDSLKSAKQDKASVSAIWLDVANAYGSVPHRLIYFALKRYGISEKWINIIQQYYQGIWSKCFQELSPSSWHHHQRGIFVGCTVSIILFLAAINVIIEFTLSLQDSFIQEHRLGMKAFMDDLFVVSSSTEGTQLLLDRCTHALSWACMSFRANKSRCIVIDRGSVKNITPFIVNLPNVEESQIIPSIHTQPVRFLGRQICASLSDSESIETFVSIFKNGLKNINSSKHNGIHKVWILQYLLLPRARWPIQIYEIPFSTVLKLEQSTSVYIRRWLKLHRSTTNICLYSSNSPCPLPIKSLTSVLKAAKISGHLLLRDSSDPLVNTSVPQLKVGQWIVEDVVRQGEDKIYFEKVLGYHQHNRAGLGSIKHQEVPPIQSHDYRKLVSEKVHELEEEQYLARAVQMRLQGNWTRWCNYIQNELSWKHLLNTSSRLTSFVLGSTFDTLPSPTNLKRWHITTELDCSLCFVKVCTTAHVLSGCKVALSQGRYTFRHDSILRVMHNSLAKFLSSITPVKVVPSLSSCFVKQGKRISNTKKRPHVGVLHESSDWKILVDLDSGLVFPSFIAITSSRPDVVIYSVLKKTVILIELTSPCEENFEDRHFEKVSRYDALCVNIRENGWRHYLFAIEVGARGYCAQNVRSCFRRLGYNTKETKAVLSELSSVAVQCSFVVWLNRDCKVWTTSTDFEKQPQKDFYLIHNKVHSYRKHSPFKNKVSRESCAKSSQNVNKFYRPGLINKGNTCYINAVLQSLSVLSGFWSVLPALSSTTQDNSPLVAAYCQIMCLLRSSKSSIDPSCFIDALSRLMVGVGRSDFVVNSQQDVPEVLNYILDDFCGGSILAQDQIKVLIKKRTTCNNCMQSCEQEEMHMMLKLNVANSVKVALDEFLAEETIFDRDCPFCLSKHDASLEKRVAVVGRYLIVQLKRYLLDDGGWVKDMSLVKCVESLLPICVELDDEVQCQKSYHLVASFCHSGTLHAGHYTAHVLNKDDEQWLLCNDKAVLPIKSSEVDNKYSYVLFYESS